MRAWIQRLRPRGVVWRQLLAWCTANIPNAFEPFFMFLWTGTFWLLWTPGRQSVYRNLCAIFPSSPGIVNWLRSFRVFWGFAWTFTDTMHFNVTRRAVDWQLDGLENFDQIRDESEGCIVLTAHMGNYDLGSYIFSEKIGRPLLTIRAPEADPETEVDAARRRAGIAEGRLAVTHNVDADALALDVLASLRGGGIVAIQGDRVVGNLARSEVEFFGQPSALPTGPFALSMIARVKIYPMFILRDGRRRYRVIAHPPIRCERTGRDRAVDINRAVEEWRVLLESTVREHWHQWYAFEPFMKADR